MARLPRAHAVFARGAGRIARIMTDDSTDWIAVKDGPKSDEEKAIPSLSGPYPTGRRAKRLPGADDVREPSGQPPGMTFGDAHRVRSPKTRRLPVDDLYTAWFNANSGCGEALRVWLRAAPAARPSAFRAYQAALAREEAAAAELELYAKAPPA